MGTLSNIFVYVFIYFLGYYGANILNMFTVRPLITNRFIAALIPVLCFAMLHGYHIATTSSKTPTNETIESALFFNVITPVIIVALGAVYFMWNSRQPEEEEAEEAARRAAEDAEEDDDENLKDEQETSGASAADKTTPDADEKRN